MQESHLAARSTYFHGNSFAVGMGWGAFAATLLMLFILGLRPDLAEAVQLPMFWIKIAFTATLVAASVLAAQRLSQPGVPLGWAPAGLATPVFAMSITNGACRPAGAATDHGLVPMIFRRPPQGAIAGPPLLASSITHPARAPISV